MGPFPWQTGRLDPRAGGKAYHGAHHGEPHGSSTSGVPKAALILGVTGIVGNYLAELLSKPSAPGGPWKVYGVGRRPRPTWLPSSMEYLQVDLLDREATLAKLGALKDVTHMFFTTWVQGKTEKENIELNSRLLQNPVDALLPNENFQHIVLQTGGKQYTGPFELAGKIKPYEAPFEEDVPRLPYDQFYYHQEDIVFEAAKKSNGRLTYSIHRPTIIFGFAAGNLMNVIGTVAVYALLCRQEGKPFMFPGNEFTYERLFDASDAELIAEQEIWACVDLAAKNQALNSNNGDVFKWKTLWKILGERFGLEVPEYRDLGSPLVEVMKGKEDVWDQGGEGVQAGAREAGRGWPLVVCGFDSAPGSGERGQHEQEQGAWVSGLAQHGAVLHGGSGQDEGQQSDSLKSSAYSVDPLFLQWLGV